jgi:hypothetical protein
LLVDGLVNPVPSPINLVDQVVNLVSSSVEPLTKVVDPVLSSINPTFHLESETQVTDPVPSLVCPTLHPKSIKVVDPTPPSVDPTPPLRSVKVVALVTSSVNPTPPLKSAKVTDPIPSSVNPTPPMMSAKVVSLITSSVNPTLPLTSAKVVAPVNSSINPTLPLMSAKLVASVTSSVNPTLPLNSAKVVNSIPSLIDPTLLLESKPDSTHVFLVEIGSTMPGGIPPSPTKNLLSNEAILFEWGVINRPLLPSHMPFKITVKVCGRDVPHALINEGSSISIFSSISWQGLGYPQLVPVTQTLFAFNRRTSHPLGILLQFPITLGGKTIFIDVMVVQDPLDFDLLLGRDYVYAMKAIVSTLFHVIYFLHNGRMVTIDQLSFVGHDLTINPITSLNGPYMQ